MHFTQRRQILLASAAIGVSHLPAWSQSASTFPNKTVRLVVGVPAGAPTDLYARALAEFLSKSTGQSFIVDNRPGAGGNIATLAVAKAAPDGYTLLVAGTGIVSNLALYRNPGYVLEKDFATVGLYLREPALLVVSANSPIKTAAELVSAMKTKSNGATFGSGGMGTGAHITGNAIARAVGFNSIHVPYRGAAELVNAIIGGQVDYGVPTISGALPLVRSGRLRALAVTSEKRNIALPEVPTLNETIMPGFNLIGFNPVLAPAATPKDVVAKLHAEVTKFAKDASLAKLATTNGAEPFYFKSPAESMAYLESEIPKWRKYISDAGAKID